MQREIARIALVLSPVLVAFPAACGRSDDGAEARTSSQELSRVRPDEVVDQAGVHVRLDPERGELRLAPDTSVAYDVETLAPTRLVLAGTAEGAGSLELSLDAIDPATGERGDEILATRIRLEDEPLGRGIVVPEQHGRYVRLELAWTGAPESGFRLTSLRRVESPPARRVPVILIAIDTLSALHLPFYGYPRETAPRLTELAQDSTLFLHCRTNAPWTLPSFMAEMSGLFSFASHVDLPDAGRDEMWDHFHLADNRWTMAELFHAAGYDTAAFVNHWLLAPQFGFAQGFEVFDREAFDLPKWAPEGGIRLDVRKALSWIDARADRPFFLFLHAFDVHGPYVPQESDRGRFHGGGIYDAEKRAPVGPDGSVHSVERYHLESSPYEDAEPGDLVPTEYFADSYDDCIRTVDRSVGHLVDELKRRGLYDSCVIVFTADHGETMDDGVNYFSHRRMDESVLNVPLIVHLPGGRGRGVRIADTVQLVDLYPTFLDLLGLEPRAWLHGRSLLPLIDGQEEGPRTVYIQGGQMQETCLVRDGWKIVRHAPGWTPPIVWILSQPDLGSRWRKEILPWARSQEELAPDLRAMDLDEVARLLARAEETGTDGDLLAAVQGDPTLVHLLHVLRAYFDRERLRLYDLGADPGAKDDVAAEHPERVEEMLRWLSAAQQRMENARALARPPGHAPELPAEAQEQLKALGYAGD